MKKFVVVATIVLMLAVTACQLTKTPQKMGDIIPIECEGSAPEVPPIQFDETICTYLNGVLVSCKSVPFEFYPQCTHKGWAYKPFLGSGVGIPSTDILPGGEQSFSVPTNTQLYFNTVFLYEKPTKETGYEALFNNGFLSVTVDEEEWIITKSGLLISPSGEDIIPQGSKITIHNEEGVEHLPELTRSWVNNLYNLIEAVVIVP